MEEYFFSTIDFLINLPVLYQVILGILIVAIIFAIVKKLVKFAVYLALLAVLILIALRLMNVQVEVPGLEEQIMEYVQ